ncbi:MAG: histidine kinase [Hyphomicrobiales bacterium]|nr:MAG: histidine kinase [Hyphomicrobiales bacterium]
MRSLLMASDDCIKVLDLDGKLSFMSEGGQRVMEISDFNAIKGCPWPNFWLGQGNADALHAVAEARAGRSYRFQSVANTGLGNPRHWDVQVAPITGADGKPESILSVSRDITQLKEAEDRLRLLALELKHRMKNTIAMIQAIANQTMKAGTDVGEIKTIFLARLATLSSAQDLLTQTEWARARLLDLVESSLAPHGERSRFAIEGPDVELSSKCALGLALALHELATNANKYGALKNDDGRVTVRWTVDGDTFHFVWTETDGPPVLAPTRSGFGSRMIEKALAGYFQGSAGIEYRPDGVVVTLKAPVDALTTE